MILSPRCVKNRLARNGETKIGRHGKKYLPSSNGRRNATPRPPSVIASSTLCDSVIRNNNELCHARSASVPPSHHPAATPTITANKIECVMPRCPQNSPYLMPKLKPITSTSGNAEHIIARAQNLQFCRRRCSAPCPSAAPTIKWVGMLGMPDQFQSPMEYYKKGLEIFLILSSGLSINRFFSSPTGSNSTSILIYGQSFKTHSRHRRFDKPPSSVKTPSNSALVIPGFIVATERNTWSIHCRCSRRLSSFFPWSNEIHPPPTHTHTIPI